MNLRSRDKDAKFVVYSCDVHHPLPPQPSMTVSPGATRSRLLSHPNSRASAHTDATGCALRRLRKRRLFRQAGGMGLPAVQKSSRAMRGLRRGSSGFGYRTGFRTGANRGIVDAPGFGLTAAAGFFRGRRRFGIFCRRSHTRSVSSEIVTPNLASDWASSRMDAFARRSASSTSRYGSSSANRWERGRRPSATNRASISALPGDVPADAGAIDAESAGVVVPGPWSCVGAAWTPAGGRPGDSGVRVSCSAADAGGWFDGMPVNYRASSGRAMGALGSGSKRKRLDVGVVAHVCERQHGDGLSVRHRHGSQSRNRRGLRFRDRPDRRCGVLRAGPHHEEADERDNNETRGSHRQEQRTGHRRGSNGDRWRRGTRLCTAAASRWRWFGTGLDIWT